MTARLARLAPGGYYDAFPSLSMVKLASDVGAMACFGQDPQHVLPELRRKTNRDHSVHVDHMVSGGSINYHLAFAPGLTPEQSRAIVRDMEREQRRQQTDADRQREALMLEKSRAAKYAEAESDQSELQQLNQRLFALRGRLESKTLPSKALPPSGPPASQPDAAPTRAERLAALLVQ